MVELPENFPEYSIMYKTLLNQIKILEKSKENTQGKDREILQSKIKKYQLEIIKIKKMFPDNFFEELR
ncbi:MAG: hypothetical protein OEW78_00530 [Nitrosopumilus sp.]|uniref:hypothetical protein n=1 Tax=Nitrosopumilus sp. TaxID=2024843 RepID=UPI00246DE9C8|nr:hypothetical protein [Nitrosopumilus sp.]MDH5430356.1 hypothetical protein [Nitrosopumilus sp.]MDH5666158.1 hypothetical protein [Nitrosopumilus sp.]MDH5697383.1 hypothetical protein [Nitrosopumilus sp.]